jgi:DNA-binding MarR family transcriptional regulator
MTTPPTLTTRTIGETEKALRAVLGRVLDGTGIDYVTWVALVMVARARSPITSTALLEQLSDALKIDEDTAGSVLHRLAAKGLVEESTTLSLTPDGAATFARLSYAVERVTAQIWSGLDQADLEAAHRVHTTLIQRANAVLVPRLRRLEDPRAMHAAWRPPRRRLGPRSVASLKRQGRSLREA